MTEMTDFELALERRLVAHAATVTRPVSASEIVRSTITVAAMPVRRSMLGGPWRPTLLVGIGAILLLSAVAALAILGQRPPTIEGVFTEGPSLTAGRIATALVLPDGRVLASVAPVEGVVPGTTTLDCDPCLSQLTILDPQTNAFTPTALLPPGQVAESMTLLDDGRVLIVSASTEWGHEPAATIYDPVTDRYEPVGGPPAARAWPFLVTLADGRVLLVGGEASDVPATAELFDPATGTFAPTGSLAQPRTNGVTLTRLTDGRVLVVGGGERVGASAELFDPGTGTFSATGAMTVARGAFHSATLLADGRVLVVGGLVPDAADPRATPDPTAAAEVFDPTTRRFAPVDSMAAARYMHSASILSDGTVLVAGGAHELKPVSRPGISDGAEIFDPGTGTFRRTGDMNVARLWASAVAIDDRVLILGSHNSPGDDSEAARSTEWFD